MTDSEKYTLFLIEQYRQKNNAKARAVYNAFKDNGIFDYIEATFEAIHTMDTATVVSEIEELIHRKKQNVTH